jgi:ParB/RepB/Spo0J family partition protein
MQKATLNANSYVLSAPVIKHLKLSLEINERNKRISPIFDPNEIEVSPHKNRTLEQTVIDVITKISGVNPEGSVFHFPDARAKIEAAIKAGFIPKEVPKFLAVNLEDGTYRILHNTEGVGLIYPGGGKRWKFESGSNTYETPAMAAYALLISLNLLELGTTLDIMWGKSQIRFVPPNLVPGSTEDQPAESLPLEDAPITPELPIVATIETQPENVATPAPGVTNEPLSRFLESTLNPRKSFDGASLEELAISIRQKGILQNLVARPHPNQPGKLEIACGARRYRAAMLNVEHAHWTPEHLIPVSVRELTDLELLVLAGIENLDRADMHPMDEAELFALLERKCMSREDISLQMGRSIGTVHQRIGLATKLDEKVISAYREGKIGLGQAQAFTIADEKAQRTMLTQVVKDPNDYWSRPSGIRQMLSSKHILVANAIFETSSYKGEIVEDLYGMTEPFFKDSTQAQKLQLEAIDALKTKLEEKWAWVEVFKQHHFSEYSFEINGKTQHLTKSKDKKLAGAVIHVRPESLKVEVHSGYAIATPTKGSPASKAVSEERKQRKLADIDVTDMAAHLETLLKTPTTIAPLLLEHLKRIPNRFIDDPAQNTRKIRIELLANHILKSRFLERTELIAALEQTGIAYQKYTVDVPSPKSMESSSNIGLLVYDGKLWLGLCDYGGLVDLPPINIPVHCTEILKMADLHLDSKANGSSSNLIRVLESALVLNGKGYVFIEGGK